MILVSACLLGVACRYDGQAQVVSPEAERLQAQGLAVAVCPEQLGGLGTPREPAEIVGGTAADVLAGRARVRRASGADVTAEFVAGANLTVELARKHGARLAILKERSPSCGVQEVYDGRFERQAIPGCGVTAQALRDLGVEVRSERAMEGAT